MAEARPMSSKKFALIFIITISIATVLFLAFTLGTMTSGDGEDDDDDDHLDDSFNSWLLISIFFGGISLSRTLLKSPSNFKIADFSIKLSFCLTKRL
ncbi:MAG: hypothetical protein ACTSR8_03855 [Promethearchaeota archaeon]